MRVSDLRELQKFGAQHGPTPFLPATLFHLYVKMDLPHSLECATSAKDARAFLRAVTRAALVADTVAREFSGLLVEVQGSMLHLALASSSDDDERIKEVLAALHHGFARAFSSDRPSAVTSWRMAVDSGWTMIVAGRGIHGDESMVSLGDAANRPAKYLYAELSLSEEQRRTKAFYAAIRDPRTGEWHHVRLPEHRCPPRLEKTAEAVLLEDIDLDFDMFGGPLLKRASSAVESAAELSSDDPSAFFGWIMRADLDGFTSRVAACKEKPHELESLAEDFRNLMDTAASFASRHSAAMVQLPWAGDNFTAAMVFPTKAAYDESCERGPVDIVLDFEKEMQDATKAAHLQGWAYSVAGGDVHGNALGNLFFGSAKVSEKRHLIGSGQGVGRSSQGFVDIAPELRDVIFFKQDYRRLAHLYRAAFQSTEKSDGAISALYKRAHADELKKVRVACDTKAQKTTVTLGTGGSRVRPVGGKPYFRWRHR